MAGSGRLSTRLVVAGVLLASPTALAQDSPITGARFTLVERNESALSVTLENLRNSPLVAWEIGVVPPGSRTPTAVHSSDYTMARSDAAGPVAPRSRRLLTIPISAPIAGSTAVTKLAVFADGYYEGQADAVDAFQRRRLPEVDNLRYWIAVLNKLPLGTDEAVRSFLKAHLIQRAGEETGRLALAGTLTSLAMQNVPRPAGWLRAVLDGKRTEAQNLLAVLEREPIPGSPQRAGEATSVRITSSAAIRGRLYALIENLRDVPIEAVALGKYAAPGDNRLVAGRTEDFCGVLESGPGNTRIAPGETRELSLSWNRTPDGTPPTVELRMVMFDDLRWEGSASERESVLRQRERRADQIAYWIAALTDAAAQTPEKARALLEARKREAITAWTLTGGAHTGDVDQVLERIGHRPEEFAAMATGIASHLAQERARLTRHRSR
jgi:hypothetical protein